MGWSRRVALASAAAAALAGPAGWIVTDRLESDNDFCNACHLEPGVPLHREIRRDFDAREAPRSLAARHAAAGRSGAAFRCFDCHGGASFVGRARVKLLAAKDAFWYATGRFEEPDGMRWPLWDEDCTQCHARFEEREPQAWESPRFHQLGVHNAALGIDCVACHLAHDAPPEPTPHFLHAAHVRAQCARCHSEFGEGER